MHRGAVDVIAIPELRMYIAVRRDFLFPSQFFHSADFLVRVAVGNQIPSGELMTVTSVSLKSKKLSRCQYWRPVRVPWIENWNTDEYARGKALVVMHWRASWVWQLPQLLPAVVNCHGNPKCRPKLICCRVMLGFGKRKPGETRA